MCSKFIRAFPVPTRARGRRTRRAQMRKHESSTVNEFFNSRHNYIATYTILIQKNDKTKYIHAVRTVRMTRTVRTACTVYL